MTHAAKAIVLEMTIQTLDDDASEQALLDLVSDIKELPPTLAVHLLVKLSETLILRQPYV